MPEHLPPCESAYTADSMHECQEYVTTYCNAIVTWMSTGTAIDMPALESNSCLNPVNLHAKLTACMIVEHMPVQSILVEDCTGC